MTVSSYIFAFWVLLSETALEQGLEHSSVKGQVVNIFDFVGHAVSGVKFNSAVV